MRKILENKRDELSNISINAIYRLKVFKKIKNSKISKGWECDEY
jgi:hypothetical protein